MTDNFPLVVDLDGTITSTDILMESMLELLKRNPLYIFLIIIWVAKGYAFLKQKIYERTQIDVSNLAYNQDVIDFVRLEKSKGRQIILATASLEPIAKQVADYLGIFDKILATTPQLNLRGNNKRQILIEYYGEKGFDYIGDAYVDLYIWESSRYAYLVRPPKFLLWRAEKIARVEKIFPPKKSKIETFFDEIRYKQWLKNTLIFVPILLAHRFELIEYLYLLIGFIAFSFTSSSIYLLNDLIDIPSDRKHPLKRNRPLASGEMHITTGFYLSIFFFVAGFIISIAFLHPAFVIVQAIYFLSNWLYSRYLKKEVIIDIVVLSILYALRLIAGAVQADVDLSNWLLTFAIFLFLSLATLKRYLELGLLQKDGRSNSSRGYTIEDRPILQLSGVSLGLISSLIFALYTQSDKVAALYSHPNYLIGIVLVIVLFLLRTWVLSSRQVQNDDPLEIVMKDRVNYILLAISLVIILLAI
ncbi:MAG TPA: UbiA family prenyltransferase [Bacteroidetes bacterium]|nr:UbiA family prenyltransferase [Bacteroidota bacterium]